MSVPSAATSSGPDHAAIRKALISVSDKTGLAEFAAGLAAAGVEILSTGGTARALQDAGIAVTDVSAVTGFPEIMDGRVKTLHPMIHGGLLAHRDNPGHAAAMTEHGIAGIDLLVVNLYPFAQTVAGGGDYFTAVENIDIGGPAMIRAAAKNAAFVTVITDPGDYDAVLGEMKAQDGISRRTRRALAARAFALTAAYDGAIANWYAVQLEEETPEGATGETAKPQFPGRLSLPARLKSALRYGENPHQAAALYITDAQGPGAAAADLIQGKELSFNNLNDADAALALIAEFGAGEAATLAIIKHANPCGVASADTLVAAHQAALACDPVSAYGGIVAVNRPLDAEAASAITALFTEVVIAPDADAEALMIFSNKPNLRLLITGSLPDPHVPGLDVRTISGGLLVQTRDNGVVGMDELKVMTKRPPTDRERADMLFAFKVGKHVKSNAIVYVRDGATVGIGAGQMSRVDSARIAAAKAKDAARAAGLQTPLTQGSVVASDAFFPFADGLMAAIEAGATAVIQPGGSMRDDEVIAAADEAGIAMVFTGMRHFRH
jgi:phosphoribosylaminoimidazolecarboxamide formyltransferase/IMP cyclohydrolase